MKSEKPRFIAGKMQRRRAFWVAIAAGQRKRNSPSFAAARDRKKFVVVGGGLPAA